MAKSVILTSGAETLAFSATRVDRSKVYGTRKRIAVDSDGRACTRAALTADGDQLLISGMVAQGHFTSDGLLVARKEMVGLDVEGNTVDVKPSTLGVAQVVEGPVDAIEVLDLEVQSVFYLEPEQASGKLLEKLKSGEVYKCPFNYAAGLEVETAYLVANKEEVYAIVGKPVVERWFEEGEVFTSTEEEENLDDLDFEAL